MSSAVDLHVIYRVANAPVRDYPFPHVLVHDVFPADFYDELRANLPEQGALKTLGALGRIKGGDYPARLVMPLTPENTAKLPAQQRAFWERLGDWILGGGFGRMMVAKFEPWLKNRFPDLAKQSFSDEVLIVRDGTSYALGPHTDARHKVLSFLFYLPADDSQRHLGTSIYLPHEPQFRCEGGPEHDRRRFRLMATMPFAPNTLFAFMKTSNSFHGVEPIRGPAVRRDLLLYDIHLRPAAAPAQPAVKFSF